MLASLTAKNARERTAAETLAVVTRYEFPTNGDLSRHPVAG